MTKIINYSLIIIGIAAAIGFIFSLLDFEIYESIPEHEQRTIGLLTTLDSNLSQVMDSYEIRSINCYYSSEVDKYYFEFEIHMIGTDSNNITREVTNIGYYISDGKLNSNVGDMYMSQDLELNQFENVKTEIFDVINNSNPIESYTRLDILELLNK